MADVTLPPLAPGCSAPTPLGGGWHCGMQAWRATSPSAGAVRGLHRSSAAIPLCREPLQIRFVPAPRLPRPRDEGGRRAPPRGPSGDYLGHAPPFHSAASHSRSVSSLLRASCSRAKSASVFFRDRKSTRLNSSHLGISYAV